MDLDWLRKLPVLVVGFVAVACGADDDKRWVYLQHNGRDVRLPCELVGRRKVAGMEEYVYRIGVISERYRVSAFSGIEGAVVCAIGGKEAAIRGILGDHGNGLVVATGIGHLRIANGHGKVAWKALSDRLVVDPNAWPIQQGECVVATKWLGDGMVGGNVGHVSLLEGNIGVGMLDGRAYGNPGTCVYLLCRAEVLGYGMVDDREVRAVVRPGEFVGTLVYDSSVGMAFVVGVHPDLVEVRVISETCAGQVKSVGYVLPEEDCPGAIKQFLVTTMSAHGLGRGGKIEIAVYCDGSLARQEDAGRVESVSDFVQKIVAGVDARAESRLDVVVRENLVLSEKSADANGR